jgi:hypothetical protein
MPMSFDESPTGTLWNGALPLLSSQHKLAWCDSLTNARRHLQALGAPEPELPPFDASKFEPMPDVELNPRDEFYVEIDEG